MEFSPGKYICLSQLVVGGQEFFGEAYPLTEGHGPGFFGYEAVGAAFDDKTIDALRGDISSHAVLFFKDNDLAPRLAALAPLVLPEAIGGGEPRDTSAYNNNPFRQYISPIFLTRPARRARNFGESLSEGVLLNLSPSLSAVPLKRISIS